MARCLQQLGDGEQLSAGAFSNKVLLNRYVEDGVLVKRAISARRSQVGCPDVQRLHNYLRQQYGILSLDKYIENYEGRGTDGVGSLEAVTSTKTFRKESLQGFFIKSWNAGGMLNGQALPSVPEGAELFIVDFAALAVDPEVVIVGVENPECFRKLEQLKHLFPNVPLLFVMRYQSISPQKWLMTIPNRYLHFGDFDPAGIAIYYHEYLKVLGEERCTFLIPKGIEELIENFGNRELYNKQAHQMPAKDQIQQTDLRKLMETMQRTGKGLEQERLLVSGIR